MEFFLRKFHKDEEQVWMAWFSLLISLACNFMLLKKSEKWKAKKEKKLFQFFKSFNGINLSPQSCVCRSGQLAFIWSVGWSLGEVHFFHYLFFHKWNKGDRGRERERAHAKWNKCAVMKLVISFCSVSLWLEKERKRKKDMKWNAMSESSAILIMHTRKSKNIIIFVPRNEYKRT